jgi:hypothetical protein
MINKNRARNIYFPYCLKSNHVLLPLISHPFPFLTHSSAIWFLRSTLIPFSPIHATNTIQINLISSSFKVQFHQDYYWRFNKFHVRLQSVKEDLWSRWSMWFPYHFFSDGMEDPASYGNHENDIEQVSFIKGFLITGT